MDALSKEITQAIRGFESKDPDTYQQFLDRIERGNLNKDEDQASHFCAYFLPYNKSAQTVFYGHHKKSGLWLSPGGQGFMSIYETR